MNITYTMQDGSIYNGIPKIKSKTKMTDVKLIPRRLGKVEIQSKLSQLIVDVIKDVTPNNMLFQSCIVCEHFNNETEICSQFRVRPPARIIVFGCIKFEESSHIDDDIPF